MNLSKTIFTLVTLSLISVGAFGGENSENSDDFTADEKEFNSKFVDVVGGGAELLWGLDALNHITNMNIRSSRELEVDNARRNLRKIRSMYPGDLGHNDIYNAEVRLGAAKRLAGEATVSHAPNYRSMRWKAGLGLINAAIAIDGTTRVFRGLFGDEKEMKLSSPFSDFIYETGQEGAQKAGSMLFGNEAEPSQPLSIEEESTH